jgi:OFA family oxalate/formate antiporter-like MFS transporter
MTQTSSATEVAIGMIFIAGRIQDRRGPRTVAMVGGAIYGIGVVLASFARSGDQLWLLVLGYTPRRPSSRWR